METEELGNGVSVIRKCLAMQMPSLGTKDKKGGKSEPSKPKKTCWKCGGSFPHATECPKKDESCDYCKETNHVKKFCKKFKKDNNKNKGDSNEEKAEAIQVVGGWFSFYCLSSLRTS